MYLVNNKHRPKVSIIWSTIYHLSPQTGDILMAEDIIKHLNDDQLAFAIAHEMVHVVQRHYVSAVCRV